MNKKFDSVIVPLSSKAESVRIRRKCYRLANEILERDKKVKVNGGEKI